MTDTSWQKVQAWYKKSVGEKGHYYHQHVVIPAVIKLLNLPKNGANLLDIACGQGVLARALPQNVEYTGLDAAASLIQDAKKQDNNPHHKFLVADATKPLKLTDNSFTHATIILALQNIEYPEAVFESAAKALTKNGTFVLVINHPSFRIPRHSSWEIDPQNHLQYRRINGYMSPQKIPVTAHPGQKDSPITWSFHYPLSTYSQWLKAAGFVIEAIEEWTSDKESVGKSAKMENRARNEIPLFMALVCKKL